MATKRKHSGTAGPEPGFSPKPKRGERMSADGDPSPPTPTPEPFTPDLVPNRRKKKQKHQSKRRKS